MMDRALASGDFWAITAYFNPLGYERRRDNYVRFRAALDLPLVVVEMAASGHFEIEDDARTRVVRLRDGDLMFQKEALLNVALDHVPAHVKYIAWLDCDVILTRDDWTDLARAELALAPLVQIFTEVYDLLPCGTRDPLPPLTGHGIAALEALSLDAIRTDSNEPARGMFRGLAWAARADLLRRHRLYDAMIVGGGDRAVEGAAYGRIDETCAMLALNPARRDHYEAWAHEFHAEVAGRVGALPGGLLHLWHGDTEKRAYRTRHRQLADLGFDPATDLKRGESGLWRWSRPRAELTEFMAGYFAARREDG